MTSPVDAAPAATESGTDRPRPREVRRRRLHPVSLLVLAALLALTAVATFATDAVVRSQEHRLLLERTREVALVLTTAVQSISPTLGTLDQVLDATGGSRAAFTRAAANEVAAGPGELSFALVHHTAGGWIVEAATGRALRVGQTVTGTRAESMEAALRSSRLAATPVLGTGARRSIGYALRAHNAAGSTVIYRESTLGAVKAPREVASAPFRELNVVLYATPTAESGQVLVATTLDLPLRGSVGHATAVAGSSRWLIAASATHPLVGTVAADAPWAVLLAGIVGAALIAVAIESESRRREAAWSLYTSEHNLAETLQRSLLPALPALGGLELAARYLAGGAGQQVGGDWFDAFPIGGGRVGIVIGDVVGHDLVAATAMSQIRASLRAYAWQGDDPSTVLERLDRLVDAFGLAQLVTIFYGVFDPPALDGSRMLHYANAGHLPPLLRRPDGAVAPLTGGESVVIGAPTSRRRAEAQQRLDVQAVLFLYTDGLVEVPGGSLDDALAGLAGTVSGYRDGQPADALCERALAAMLPSRSHDDIAMLAVRLLPADAPAPTGVEPISAGVTDGSADAPLGPAHPGPLVERRRALVPSSDRGPSH